MSWVLGMLALSSLLGACTTPPRSQVLMESEVQLSSYEGFAWAEHAAGTQSKPTFLMDEGALQRTVEAALTNAGYLPVSRESADYLLEMTWEASAYEEGGISLGFGFGSYGRHSSVGVGMQGPTIGGGTRYRWLLTVRAVDAATGTVAWVGWIEGLKDDESLESRVGPMLSEMMVEFPEKS